MLRLGKYLQTQLVYRPNLYTYYLQVLDYFLDWHWKNLINIDLFIIVKSAAR